MTGLTGSLAIRVNLQLVNTLDVGTVSMPVNFEEKITLTFGDGANQMKEVFSDDRTLADSTGETLDLSGSLTNCFGETINFAGVKALYIKNTGTTTLTVGNAAANTWVGPFGNATHTTVMSPGEVRYFTNPSAAGWPVAAGSTDNLKILNSAGGSGTYRIVIGGDLA